MYKFLFSVFTFVLCAMPFSVVHAQNTIETPAKQAIVVDYQTGAVLMAKNADDKMPTSSMSKVMTMYVVFDALEKGAFKLSDTFAVSEKAWRMGGSKMFVGLNDRISIEDLVRGVVVQSGNDATIVLAEGVSGSEGAFSDALNEKAKELGMKNSNFMNASGWPDDNHYSTARDLAILAAAQIKHFPEYYKYYAEKDFTYNSIKQGNRNPLLYKNIGADGIKTGHTEAGGYGLIGSGVQNGRRVIIVVNGLADQSERAEESAKLLEWGLTRFENKVLAKKGQVVEQANVAMGKAATVGMIAQKDALVTLPKMASKDVKIQVKYNGPLVAPIAQGDEIGVLEVSIPSAETISIPLYADQAVSELGLFAKTMRKAKNFVSRSNPLNET